VDAVVVSPDHHFPSGVALSPERRRALVDWAVGGDRLVVDHDYDSHFRYDRPPAAVPQGLAPEHVAYVGGASGLLAAARRRGLALDGVNEHALQAQPPGLVLGFAAAPEPTRRRALELLGGGR
jgi:hypothetical protein